MCALLANPLSTRCAPKGQNYEILAVPREGRLRALRLHAAPFLPSLIIILSTELSPGILGPSYLGSRSPGKSCLPGVCFVGPSPGSRSRSLPKGDVRDTDWFG